MAQLIEEKHNRYSNNIEEDAKISRECRKFIDAHYSWEKNISSTEAHFMEVIKK